MAAGNIAISETETPVATARRRRDRVELCIGYALILVVIWTPRPWQRLSYLVASVFLVAVLWRSNPGLKAMGLRPPNFVRSLWLIGVALLAAAIGMVVASRMNTLHAPDGPVEFFERYTGYAIGACIQQVLLQCFFLPRLLRLTRGPGHAALAASGLFSLAHLPNPILTVITIFWGLASCLYFLRYRNLYALVVAHTILGAAVAICVPGPTIHNMRVGLGYLTYSSHPIHHRSH
jgi:membrane protease YdiL (CAAX protease family)